MRRASRGRMHASMCLACRARACGSVESKSSPLGETGRSGAARPGWCKCDSTGLGTHFLETPSWHSLAQVLGKGLFPHLPPSRPTRRLHAEPLSAGPRPAAQDFPRWGCSTSGPGSRFCSGRCNAPTRADPRGSCGAPELGKQQTSQTMASAEVGADCPPSLMHTSVLSTRQTRYLHSKSASPCAEAGKSL